MEDAVAASSLESRLARLEGLQATMRPALRHQEHRADKLAAQLVELREENATLRNCLECLGVLQESWFLARLHSSRFARILREHPLRGRFVNLEEVSRARELALMTMGLAGPGSVLSLGATSKTVASSLTAITTELSCLFPVAIYAVGGVGGVRGPLPSVERLRPVLADAAELADSAACLAAPRAVCAAVSVSGQVYAIAGRGADGAALSSVERYDPVTNMWHQAPPLQRARGWVAATCLGGSICVLGGEGDDLTLDVAEQLDAGANAWEPLPSMLTPRWAAAAASIGHHVFVVGGHSADGEVLGDVECLSARGRSQLVPPCSTGWAQLAPLHCPRAALALAALGGCLYAVGGYDEHERGLPSMERYDPNQGIWESLAPMATPRWGLGAIGCGGHLYVLGGTVGNGLVNAGVVKRFDPDSEIWENVGRLRIARRCCGVASCR